MMSWIWQHFNKDVVKSTAKCKLCPRSFSFKGGNGSLLYHLTHIHHLNNTTATSTSSACRDSSGRSMSSSSVKDSASVNFAESGQLSSWISSSSSRPCSSSRAETLTSMIVNCVTKDLQQVSFLEDSALRDLLLYVEPNYQPPCHKTIRRHMMLQYDGLKQTVFDRLKAEIGVSITCDGWTNSQMDGFLSVMAHFIDSEWNMCCVNVDSPSLDTQHTGAAISDAIDSCLTNVGTTAFCCTHDTAANMNLALRLSTLCTYSIGCMAHILQLAIKDAFVDKTSKVDSIIDRVKSAITIIRKSENLSREFRKCRDQLLPNANKRELQLCNATRWNSIYIMLDSFVELHVAMDFMTKSYSGIRAADRQKLEFTATDIEVIRDVIKFLQGFKLATEQWEAEKYVTISTVYPIIFSIVRSIKAMQCHKHLEYFRACLINNVETRFCLNDTEYLGKYSVHMIASQLDPRFKDLTFVTDETKCHIGQNIATELAKLSLTKPEPEIEPTAKRSRLEILLGDTIATTSATVEQCEFTEYLRGPQVGIDSCPLQFWKANALRFPKLAVLAKKYLAIQATSASSERLFSTFGNTYEDQRMRLNRDTAAAIVFLHHNK